MPPQNYDFSNYQSPFEAGLSGFGQGLNAVEDFRTKRKKEAMADLLYKYDLQKLSDDIEAARIRGGLGPTNGAPAQPATPAAQPGGPTFTRSGEGAIASPSRPAAASPLGDVPSPGPEHAGAQLPQANMPSGGIRGAVAGIRNRVGRLLSGGFDAPEIEHLRKTGPSEAESLLSTRESGENTRNAATNAAHISGIGLENQGRLADEKARGEWELAQERIRGGFHLQGIRESGRQYGHATLPQLNKTREETLDDVMDYVAKYTPNLTPDKMALEGMRIMDKDPRAQELGLVKGDYYRAAARYGTRSASQGLKARNVESLIGRRYRPDMEAGLTQHDIQRAATDSVYRRFLIETGRIQPD